MALSYVQYAGNGTTQTFAVPFPYIARAHIQVRVALDITAYTWDDAQTIRIAPAPAAGAVIEIRRITPRENRMVDFVDGSVLTETDLDLSDTQVFNIVQEAIDIAGGTLELLSDGSYGAGGRKISDLGNPVANRDAVTKEWAESGMTSQLTLAQAYANAAASSVAEVDADRVSVAADRVIVADDKATVAADKATVAADKAIVATNKTAAETARTGAEAARDAALGYRNTAEAHKNAAAASAAAAAVWDPAGFVPKTGGAFTGNVSAPGVSVGANGLYLSSGGVMADQNVAGTGNAGRTYILSNNNSFEVLTENGAGSILAARNADSHPFFRGVPLATHEWANSVFAPKQGFRIHTYVSGVLPTNYATSTNVSYLGKTDYVILGSGLPSNAVLIWECMVYGSAEGNGNVTGDTGMEAAVEMLNTPGSAWQITGNAIQKLFASPVAGAVILRGGIPLQGIIGNSHMYNNAFYTRIAFSATYAGNIANIYGAYWKGIILVPN